jgi:hypothetical protein
MDNLRSLHQLGPKVSESFATDLADRIRDPRYELRGHAPMTNIVE